MEVTVDTEEVMAVAMEVTVDTEAAMAAMVAVMAVTVADISESVKLRLSPRLMLRPMLLSVTARPATAWAAMLWAAMPWAAMAVMATWATAGLTSLIPLSAATADMAMSGSARPRLSLRLGVATMAATDAATADMAAMVATDAATAAMAVTDAAMVVTVAVMAGKKLNSQYIKNCPT